MTIAQDTVIKLIRLAVSRKAEQLPVCPNWLEVMGIGTQQGVLGICFDGVELLPIDQRPDMNNLWNWLGQVTYMEKCYEEHLKTILDLASFYSTIGVRMMLLKGYGLSRLWPKPNHRPVGDIDIYLLEDKLSIPSVPSDHSELLYQRADRLLTEKLGIEVDNGHHHHSVFTFEGTMVENHYDFINVYSHASNQWIEQAFKEMAASGYEMADQQIKNLCYPSPTLNALFVARHNAIHFASEKMCLRQVLDWAFLLNAYHKVIDWRDFWDKTTRMGMKDFVLCMNEICVKQFGFGRDIFHEAQSVSCKEGLADRILKDIFESEDTGEHLKGFSYLKHRLSIWWTNRWKHKMVYSDSLLSTFFVQIKSHLMKPQTIFGV